MLLEFDRILDDMDTKYYGTLRQFVIGNEAKNLRENIYEFMTLSTLCHSENTINALDIDGILNQMEKIFHLKNIPDIHIINAVNKLEESGVIIKTGRIYSIPDEQCNIIKENTKISQKIEYKVKNTLEEKIIKKFGNIHDDIIKQIVENFFILLDKTIEQQGTYATRVFSTSPKDIHVLHNQSDFHPTFKETILKLIPKQYHDSLYEILEDFFSNPSIELSKYLYSIAIGDTMTKILNIDPDINVNTKKSWEKKSLIIDTNIMINLLFETSPLHNSTKLTLKKSQELGMSLYVLDETLAEFESWISSMGHAHNFVSNPSKIKLTPEILQENIFLKEFYNEKQDNKLLNISDFVSLFDHVEHKLETQYNIKTINVEIKDYDLNEELLLNIKNASNLGRKNKKAQIHDAKALEFTRIQREKSEKDETGHSFWFITEDKTLSNAEKSFYSDGIRHSVRTEVWMQIIMPYVSPTFDNITATAFSKLIASNFVVKKFTTKNMAKILSTVWQSKGLDEEYVKKTLSDVHIAKCFDEINDASYEKDDRKVNKKINTLTDLLDKKYAERMNNFEKDKIKLENKLDSHEQSISSLKTERDHNKDKLRFLKWLSASVICVTILMFSFFFIISSYDGFKIELFYTVLGIVATVMVGVFSVWYSKIGKNISK